MIQIIYSFCNVGRDAAGSKIQGYINYDSRMLSPVYGKPFVKYI